MEKKDGKRHTFVSAAVNQFGKKPLRALVSSEFSVHSWEQEKVSMREQKCSLWEHAEGHGQHVTANMLQGKDEEQWSLRKCAKGRSFKTALLYVRIPGEEATNSRRDRSEDTAESFPERMGR